MNLDIDPKFWFALQVKSKYEFIAREILQAKGYEPFVPTYRSRRRWSDRWKELELPLFPGYVFCRFNGKAAWPILTTPGVIRIVTMGSRELAQISDEEIQSIRATMKHEMSVIPWPQAAIGSTVRVKEGPLASVCGVLSSYKNKNYFVITIAAIQRSVAVPAEQCELVAAPAPKRLTDAVSSHSYDQSRRSTYDARAIGL